MDPKKFGTCIPYDDFIAHFLQPRAHTKVEPVASYQTSDGPSTTTHRANRVLNLSQSSGGDSGSVDKYDRPSLSYNAFKEMPRAHSVRGMCQNVSNTLTKTFLAQRCDYFASATHYSSDKLGRSSGPADMNAAFCGVYPSSVASVDQQARHQPVGLGLNLGQVDWSRIEMVILCEPNSQADYDPFDESVFEDLNHARIVAAQRARVLERILDYAQLIFHYQHRTHQFMVPFIGDMARILRIDRSWIFVTHRFNYRDEVAGLKLAHFFWDHALLSAAERGHDTTATRLDPSGPDAELMRKQVKNLDPDDYVRMMFADTLDERWPWWKVDVPDKCRGGSRSFLVGKPHFTAPGVTGRATRGYIALDASNPDGSPVYLKDTWRVIGNDIKQEGAVLEALHKHDVQFVPTPVCHGDLNGQETCSQMVRQSYHAGPLKTRQHYRLVVKEVGKPLEQFEHSSELVGAIWCCVFAHSQAYEEANFIHCGISTGNMLLFRNEEGTWEGLLNDWKLSKRRDQQDKKERQLDCTGTWQFMSANVLNDRTKSVLIEDELESFFHALLHLAVRFLPHNLANAHVPQFLHDYFDDYSVVGTQLRCGKTKLSAMIDGFIDISTYKIKRKDPHQLEFLVPTNASGPSTSDSTSSSEFASATSAGGHPINDVLEPWLSWLSAQYTLDRLRELESRTRMETEADGADASQDFTNGFMRVVAKVRQRSHKAGNTKDTSAATKAGKVATKTSTDGHATLIERAKKISSHTATLELLEVVLSKSRWPPLPDRVAERGATKLKQRIGSEADD